MKYSFLLTVLMASLAGWVLNYLAFSCFRRRSSFSAFEDFISSKYYRNWQKILVSLFSLIPGGWFIIYFGSIIIVAVFYGLAYILVVAGDNLNYCKNRGSKRTRKPI